MESYFALVIGLIVVVVLAMALAAYNNRAEEVVQPQQTQQKSKSKKDKKSDKKKGKTHVEEEKTSAKKKKNNKKNASAVKFTWDGKVENEDESMIELLKGSANFVAQEGRNEIKKKVNAVSSAVGQTVEKVKGKASKVLNDDNEEFEYVLMKRKKVDDKTKTKKKTAAVKETPVVEGEEKAVVAAPESETPSGKKQKGFFKRGVFQSLRDAANAEKAAKQQEDDEKQNAREKRTGKKETAEEVEPAKDDKKDKPAKAKKTGDAPEEGDRRPPRREPREPREPREAPPPPPRPAGGNFEVSSLDDMLSAISTHYGPKPKQNFAKLPQPVLFRLLRLLKVRDIIALSQVNHFLSKVSRDDKLWKNFCEKDFAIKVPKNQPTKKKFRNVYKEEYLKSKKVATK